MAKRVTMGASRYVVGLVVGVLGLLLALPVLITSLQPFRSLEAVASMTLLAASFLVVLFALDGLVWRHVLNTLSSDTNAQLKNVVDSLQALSNQVRTDGGRIEAKVQALDALLNEINRTHLQAIHANEGAAAQVKRLGAPEP